MTAPSPSPSSPSARWSATSRRPARCSLDLGARLGRLLASLPRVQQEILTLRIAVGFSAQETAEALGISAGNVRVTQHRALTRLRGMIRDDEF